MTFPSVFVLGASPTGLAVLRALGPHGVRCHVGDVEGRRHAFRSRYRFGSPILGSSPEEVVDLVVALAAKERVKPLVIPTSDSMILALANSPKVLGANLVVYQAIADGTASNLVDKESFAKLCDDVGIATADTAFPKSPEELLATAESRRFPLLLKPVLGHLWRDRLHGKKLLVVESMSDLHKLVDGFGEDCGGLMVQELIPGPERNIYVAAIYRGVDGNRDYCFVAEKTRQHPPDFGSASLATARFREEIADLSWQFVERTDYRGICGTEFKFDERDGVFKMIEVNPRPTLWFHLAGASGVDLLYGAYLDLTGRPVPPAASQKDGTRWCFWEKDLLTWGHHLRKRDVSPLSLLSTFSRANHGAVGTLRDPGPFFASPAYYAGRLFQRTFGKAQRNKCETPNS